ncbi:MAG: hypothetical protein RML15_06630 [Bacteroidota bacterium]|nr:hypothetical protein [Candidatus Kapabacteria bacterium]MCS7303221.1 hypothetical protein [Candidatus Kapabacteria bacterium]MCX7937205.1 hypothetical protein [Chlorobiota bacterium]MDW8075710.1 hypothetical protein [Bacteroidota bacterium]MDW8272068.1 hypothetical protein [Bacteroidota bacterium]
MAPRAVIHRILWTLGLLCWVGAGAIQALSRDTTVILEAADIRCTLPQASTVTIGRWSMAQYSTADIYSTQLNVPKPSFSSDSPNALSVTYGDSLHVFLAVVPEFMSTSDFLARILDLQLLAQSTRRNAPILLTYQAQRMIGLVPAEEITLELRDTTRKDSLFTLVTFASRGRDVALLVLRSRTSPRIEGSGPEQFYRRLLASVEMDRALTRDTAHLHNPIGWYIAVPLAWKNKLTTRLSTMPFVPPSATEDTIWNTAVIQLPTVQIEYYVTATSYSDTALVDFAAHIAQRGGFEQVQVPTTHYPSGAGVWYRTSSPRRGDIVETRYGIFPANGWLAIIRLTAWQRDMPHLERFLPILVAALRLPSSLDMPSRH